ncbi:MAG: S8 family peptidase [Candidatus Aminicenantes bacterium]
MKGKVLFAWIGLVVLISAGLAFPDKERSPVRESPFPDSAQKWEWIKRNMNDSEGKYAPDRILVKLSPSVSRETAVSILNLYGTSLIKRIPRLNIYCTRLPEGLSVLEAVESFSADPQVEYAEPDYKASLAVTPNDTLFKYQYALYNSGNNLIELPGSPQGTPRSDIKATAAWEETKGSRETVIAILDTGIDLGHPDLENKIISGGRDYVNDDFDATDDNGHGTFVAGIAGAETDNNEGIAGVAWNSRLLPVKCMDENGEGYYSDIISGIRWSVDEGAAVINMSLGGTVPSLALEDAVKYAFVNDVVVAAAAGNQASSVLYPAAYDDYCLAVATTDYDDKRPAWSNFGPEVDVAAPGVQIIGPVPTWYFEGYIPYGFGDGTSASTPHVAGFAALIKSFKPWLTAGEIMDIIRYSSDDVNKDTHPGVDEFIGYGRINMETALIPIILEAGK